MCWGGGGRSPGMDRGSEGGVAILLTTIKSGSEGHRAPPVYWIGTDSYPFYNLLTVFSKHAEVYAKNV